MWFEPGQFPDGIGLGVPIIFATGFNTPPGGSIGSKNHIYNDHTYCCQLGPGICAETGEPKAADKKKCMHWHETKVRQRAEDAEKLGIPLFISEFGACMDTAECVTEINQVAEINDKYLTSGWGYWQFKTYQDLTTSAGTGSEGFYNKDGSL